MPFVDRLQPLLLRGDVEAAGLLLDSLAGDDLGEAKRWFTAAKPWFAETEIAGFEGVDQDQRFVNWCNAQWIAAMCALALCGPTTAAARVPWTWLQAYRHDSGEDVFVRMLCRADRTWVEQFTTAAAAVRLGGEDATHVEGTLTRVVRAGLIRHHLPVPAGATFYGSWLSGSNAAPSRWRNDAVDIDELARDPLMPGLLFGYLASGHCGQDGWLPDATAQLVRDGVVDRTALVEHVLGLLTSPQRPRSQEVLLRILTAVELRAEETPGITYLLGVMATSHRSVATAFLPYVLDLVADGDSLRAVASVVAAREERGPKVRLVRALETEQIRTTAGDADFDEALCLLDTGEDAGFTATIERARRRLGLRADAAPPAPATAGLWDLEPVAPPAPTGWDYWPAGRDRRVEVLDAKARYTKPEHSRRVVDDVLREMARGDFDGTRFIDDVCRPLLAQGRLSLAEFNRIVRDLFVAGGLRQGWTLAMTVADESCAAARTPAGLPDLLRTLVTFAHEVPTQPLAPAIAALAAGDGTTKSGLEARRLGALLARHDVDEYLDRLRAGRPRPPQDAPAPARGLWRAASDLEPLPSDRRVVTTAHDLEVLRRVSASHTDGTYAHDHENPVRSLVHRDLLLDATVRAIHEHGPDLVRAALADIDRSYEWMDRRGVWVAPDIVLAIDLWASGELDVAGFWRLALRSHTRASMTEARTGGARHLLVEWHEAHPEPTTGEVTASLARADPEVALPGTLDAATARLGFLRACEALLMAGRTPILLATPTWGDGTLDVVDLVTRLESLDGAPVGPLDLVQALYRLRSIDGAGTPIPDLPSLRTHPALTTEAGDSSWDVATVVRRWIDGGGLPRLEPAAVDGLWTTTSLAPVRWSECAALPAELRDDPYRWNHDLVDTLRVMPRWADRVFDAAWVEGRSARTGLPSEASGPFGVPVHDQVLAVLGRTTNGYDAHEVATVLDMALRDRLDPEAAAAAAIGRHQAGTLALGLTTQRFADLVERGGLRGLWPSMLAIAAAMVAHPRRPSGLPQLLRMLTSYATEVPAPVLPEGVHRFAAGKGSTVSHVEARRLVAALESR